MATLQWSPQGWGGGPGQPSTVQQRRLQARKVSTVTLSLHQQSDSCTSSSGSSFCEIYAMDFLAAGLKLPV